MTTATIEPLEEDIPLPEQSSHTAPLLAVWAILIVLLHGIVWATGIRGYELAVAVEDGAARVERRNQAEENKDIARKAIRAQRDTLRFWTTLALLHDFVLAPLIPVVRVLLVSTAFAGLAAIAGRPVRFPLALRANARWQGIWVLGLAVQVMLITLLDSAHAGTSAAVLAAGRPLSATTWIWLRELDPFALVGWCGLAWSAVRRRQANPVIALLTILVLAGGEAMVRASFGFMMGLGMRLSFLPA